MATQLSPLSASVTRILSLTGFPPELKTRDIHAAFQEWESVNGGFKIKWIDDTSLFVVFADAVIAKRAYLQTLASPPAIFTSPTSDTTATIRPYDGPDAQAVIQAVNSRGGPNAAHRTRSSVSGALTLNGLGAAAVAHGRAGSGAGKTGGGSPPQAQLVVSPTSARREPSPTLPSIPNQPTLNALISSSLSPEMSPTAEGGKELEGAAAARTETPPRIGDAGKRMMGAALGIRHPGIAPRATATGDQAMRDVQKAMTGLNVGAD